MDWLCAKENSAGKTRHVFAKHGCPRRQQSQNMTKISKSYILTPPHHRGMRYQWRTHRWTYSPSLVTVSPPKLWILHFVSRTELQTDWWTDRWIDGWYDYLMPPTDLSGQVIKKLYSSQKKEGRPKHFNKAKSCREWAEADKVVMWNQWKQEQRTKLGGGKDLNSQQHLIPKRNMMCLWITDICSGNQVAMLKVTRSLSLVSFKVFH